MGQADPGVAHAAASLHRAESSNAARRPATFAAPSISPLGSLIAILTPRIVISDARRHNEWPPGGRRNAHARCVWFRRDLRDFDHAALAAACATRDAVYCVFVFDREILDRLPARPIGASSSSTAASSSSMRRCAPAGGGLIVRHAIARDAIPRARRRARTSTPCTPTTTTNPQAIDRDAAVARALARAGAVSARIKDQVIFERDEILTQAGTALRGVHAVPQRVARGADSGPLRGASRSRRTRTRSLAPIPPRMRFGAAVAGGARLRSEPT